MDDTEPQTAAAKVLWHFTMSLDGFVARPEHDMHWLTGVAVRPGLIEEYTRTTGAVLAGRDGFDSAIGDARPYHGQPRPPADPLSRRCRERSSIETATAAHGRARSSYSRTTRRTPGRPTASPSLAARSRRPVGNQIADYLAVWAGGCHRHLEYRSARSGGSQQHHAEQWGA